MLQRKTKIQQTAEQQTPAATAAQGATHIIFAYSLQRSQYFKYQLISIQQDTPWIYLH
jgi:hypothetical protein